MKSKRINFFYVNLLFVVSIIVSYLFLDRSIAVWMYDNLRNSNVYNFSKLIGTCVEPENVLMLMIVVFLFTCLLIVMGRRGKAKLYIFVLLSFFISLFIAAVLKFSLARYRPELLFSDNLFGFSFFSFDHSCNSFPSGHTVAVFSIALSLFYILKNKCVCWIILFFSIIVALSRIIVTAHYCSDVLCSIYLVVLVTVFVNAVFVGLKMIPGKY
jgi:membrane-associated phospholipid phosphatase